MKKECNKKDIILLGIFSFVLGAVSVKSYKWGENKYKYYKKCDEVIDVFYKGISKEISIDNVRAFIKYINNKKLTTSDLLVVRSIYEILNKSDKCPKEVSDVKLLMELNGYKEI